MEFDRIVQVRVGKPDSAGKVEFATGYLVAPRLVLTTGHVFGPGPQPGTGPVTVRRPEEGPDAFAARMVWRRKDDRVDAALVEVGPDSEWQTPASLRDLATRPPQRWGLLIGTRPHPVTACGYPRTQKDQADRLTEQLDGRVHPATGRPAPRYEISSTDPVLPHTPQPGSTATGWSGISGAALLCPDPGGDLLLGVLAGDRQARNGARLTATRTCDLLTDPDFRRLVTEHCGWEPLLEPAEPAHLLAPAARARDLRSPAMLLRADAEAVTFHGREPELQNLLHWCHQDQDTFSVRLLTGPGGQGKTRLARYLAATVREAGWIAAHLRPDLADDPTRPGPDWSPLDTSLPRLLVLDYAETLPHQVRRLIEHLRHTRHRTRLLLLARAEGEWKSDPLGAGADTRTILAAAPATELGPLLARDARPTTRTLAFTTATADLARLLGQVRGLPQADWTAIAAALRPPDDLAHPRYNSALTLQMTALAALLQHGPAPVGTAPGQPVEAVLLDHEDRYWHGTAASPMFQLAHLRPAALRRAVATAVAFGAADQAEALTTTRQIPGLPGDRALDVAEWLRALYPSAPDRYWGTLQPDRLAEYHASTQLTGPGDQTLTSPFTSATDTQQTQAITVLGRAAIAHANAGRTSAGTQVLHALDTALDVAAPGPEALQAATAALPYPSRTLARLALRLAKELAAAYRDLAEEDPEMYEPALAVSLNNLSLRYAEVGRREEAWAASEEAASVFQRLDAEDPGRHEPDLAASLNNLSLRHAEVGRREEALAKMKEAIGIRQRLAGWDPDAYEPALAASLNNLSVLYEGVGRWEEAEAASERAAAIYRRLAEADPDAYEADLAMALTNLSVDYLQVERPEKALTVGNEAVAIYRRLALADPDAYEADLAMALNNLANCCGKVVRRWEEALTLGNEAVAIYRRLAQADPHVYEPDVAMALNNLSNRYWEAGRQTEALAAIEEATSIRRHLVQAQPDIHDPELARALFTLAKVVARGPQELPHALEAATEAVEIFSKLAERWPSAYGARLRSAHAMRAEVLACMRFEGQRNPHRPLEADAADPGE